MAGLVFLDAAVLLEKPSGGTPADPSPSLTSYEQHQLDEIRGFLRRAQSSSGRLVLKEDDYSLDSKESSRLPAPMAEALASISARPDAWKAYLSEAEQHYIAQNDKWEESLLPHRWTRIPIRVFTASVASLDDETSAPLYGLPASDHKAIAEAREGRKQWEALQTRICHFSSFCKSYLVPTSKHLVQNAVPDQVVDAIRQVEAMARHASL